MKRFELFILLFCVEYSKCLEIKYELSVTTPNYQYEKSVYTKEVVTSAPNAVSITVLSDVPVLKKGMLDISPDTYYFWMYRHNLEAIEPGAFDNQNITVEILLERNKLTVICTGTFKNLRIEKLNLAYNRITHLEEGALSDLPNLRQIHLSRNRIKQFAGNCIVNTPKMRTFDMSFNNLTELGEKWFSFMDKNRTVIVGVAYNQVEKIHPKTFDGINVWNLGLGHNNISEIPGEVFSGNSIKYLGLNDNQVEILPEEFYGQKDLTDVDLKNNPLRCEVQKKLKLFAEGMTFDAQMDSLET